MGKVVHITIGTALHVLCAYKKPDMSTSAFAERIIAYILHHANTGQCIITGDFNSDIIQGKSSAILDRLMACGFTQHVQSPTTDGGTLLDHVYTRNVHVSACEVADCYYSYHDTVMLQCDKPGTTE